MVEVVNITKYKCSVCGYLHGSMIQALVCEIIPVETAYYKVGDTVTILAGDGVGESATITGVSVIQPNYYHDLTHHIMYTANLINSWGSRQLIQGIDV